MSQSISGGPRAGLKRWRGGYVRQGKRGPAYIIERWVGGVRYHVSTKCRTERAALKELEEFELDPKNYKPGGRHPDTVDPRRHLGLTSGLILEYREWMLTRRRPTTREWANTVARALADWAEDFDGVDVRDMKLRDMKDALDRRRTVRMHRVAALKGYCSWLRKEKGLLKHSEDVSIDLPTPEAVPEKQTRKKVVERERVLKVLAFLPEATKDVMLLRLATAMHVTEVRRFAKVGELVYTRGGDVLAVVVVRHKSGDLTRIPLQHKEHVEAAERIKERGYIPANGTLQLHLREACDDAEVPPFTHGIIRHSVLTWAVEMGATPQQVAEFAGHRSVSTTRRFYLDLAVPTVTVPVLTVLKGGKATG